MESIAQDLARAHNQFNRTSFISECLNGLDSLELLPRGWHIAEVMKRHLPKDFPIAVRVLLDSLGPELNATEPTGLEVFRYLPHVFYVSKYGLDSFEDAMQFQYEVTKRFSAEFSIRAYQQRHPGKTYARLQEWAKDSNVHVRRLGSEGTRPRLPWAPRLAAIQSDPSSVIALLELLKDDPELYVRRSVANNLNGIGKDHPDIAVETCRRWLEGATRERTWVVNHAPRSLVKKGHPGALKLLGVGATAKVRVRTPRFSVRTVAIGENLEFSFDVVSLAQRRQSLLVDYAVHFVKATAARRERCSS